MNAKIVNETDNEVIVDNFTGNSNIDISKYKGREVRYVITATIPYNVPCRVNLWEKSGKILIMPLLMLLLQPVILEKHIM